MTHSLTPQALHCPLAHPPLSLPSPLPSSPAVCGIIGCCRCSSARSSSSSPSPHHHHYHHNLHHHHHQHLPLLSVRLSHRHQHDSVSHVTRQVNRRQSSSLRDRGQHTKFQVDKLHTRSFREKRHTSSLENKGHAWFQVDKSHTSSSVKKTQTSFLKDKRHTTSLKDNGGHKRSLRDETHTKFQVDKIHTNSPKDVIYTNSQGNEKHTTGSLTDHRDITFQEDRALISSLSCSNSVSDLPNSSQGLVATAAVVAASKTLQWCRTALALPALLLIVLLRRKGRRLQVTQVPRLLLTLSLLTMLMGRCLASPWIEENASSVKLRAKICQPVPEENLKARLGPSYDPSRMSNQDPRTAGKRSDSSSEPEMEEASFDSYYMEDDPRAGGYVNEDFVDIVTDDGEEEEDGWFRREEDVEEEEDGMEVEEKDVEEEGFYQKKHVGSMDSPQSDQPQSLRSRDQQPDPDQLYLYMKRRRRAASSDRDRPSSAGVDSSSSSKDKKNKESLLPLRLLLSGRNRKLRRKLKKVFRKKAKKLGKKPPPWTCNMTKVWGRLKEGYFPRYLLDGRCVTDKCFYRLYNCVAQKYRVKVLKRDPDYCNPLPALSANTTYEQKWSVVRYYVTVGCNCEASDPLQRSPSGRRRNS